MHYMYWHSSLIPSLYCQLYFARWVKVNGGDEVATRLPALHNKHASQICNNSIMLPSMQDTAAGYRNEALIGQALRELCPKHNLLPEEVFITSKLGMVLHSKRSMIYIYIYMYNELNIVLFVPFFSTL